jgi:PAS domain S-box-containing protein
VHDVPRPPTLRQRVFRIAILGMAVELVLAGVIVAGFSVVASSAHRNDELRAEQADAARLQEDMRTQEAALRDYVDFADPQSLESYRRAGEGTARTLAQLRRRVTGSALAGQVTSADAAARSWQSWADALIVRAAPTDAAPEPTAFTEGNRLFAAFTAARASLANGVDADTQTARGNAYRAAVLILAALLGTAALLAVVGGLLWRRIVLFDLSPLRQLAEAATQIAAGGTARIPSSDRVDEIGELTRALQAWHSTSVERQLLIEQAPVGICRLDMTGRVLSVNPALEILAGERLVGHHWFEFSHPEDRRKDRTGYRQLTKGEIDRYRAENRYMRSDGTAFWCSVVTAAVRGPDGGPEGFISILEDITDRRRQMERAARIQRQLLPQAVPHVPGYDLAAACVPAQDVAGDFYDWFATDDGHLDLTVADVMGKGIGSALLMAALRTALRGASPDLGPAARARVAAEAMALGMGGEGLFVTLFHGRLETASGDLRYLDAGHGYCVIRRSNGEVARLPVRSLPVGVRAEEIGMWAGVEFREGRIRLEPGDTLVLHSDGLVETEEGTLEPGELVRDLDKSRDAADMVRRLMSRTPQKPPDDITVVILRRLAEM